jgi:hypothetical protein
MELGARQEKAGLVLTIVTSEDQVNGIMQVQTMTTGQSIA